MQTPRTRDLVSLGRLWAIGGLLFAMANATCFAQTDQAKKVDSFSWKSQAEGLPAECKLDSDAALGEVLRIERTGESKQQIPLLTVVKPKLTERMYFISGKIKYQDVDQPGFLEMFSTFEGPKAGSYFSRTMDVTGPMGCISGSSGWREFTLPFMVNDESFPMPSKLQVNIIVPSKGVVWLSDVTLSEQPLPATTPAATATRAANNVLSAAEAFTPSWGLLISIASIVAVVVASATAGLLIFKQKRNQANEIRRMEAMNIE